MRLSSSAAAAVSIAALAGCQMAPPSPDPTGRADADMLRVLTAYQASGAKPVSTLDVAQARLQPTPGDAAAAVARQMGVAAKQDVAKVSDITITGGATTLPARVYYPMTAQGGPMSTQGGPMVAQDGPMSAQDGSMPAQGGAQMAQDGSPAPRHGVPKPRPGQPVASGAMPVILYFHGGGWVTGTLDTYDASDRALANGTGAIVVSVQYREGPENRFPAAQDDADTSYNWLLNNAASLGGDPRRVALAGESAGGNLAIDTAIWARDTHLPAPVAELLVYPVAGTDLNTPSYNETTNAIPLNRAAIEWYVAHFTSGPIDLQDPRLNVVGKASLAGLPPTTIVSAEIDPLRSEGEALAQKLKAAGVDTEQRTFPGVTHEFFGMGAVVGQAKQAVDFANMRLKAAFVQPMAAPMAMPRAHHMRRLMN